MRKVFGFLVGVLVMVGLTGCGGSAEAAYADLVASAEAGEWGEVYDAMSLRSQARMDVALEMLVGLATAFAEEGDEDAAELEALSGRELFLRMMQNPEMAPDVIELGDYEVLDERVDGDRAELDVRRGSKVETVGFVKEDGAWKLDADLDSGDDEEGPESEGEGEAEAASMDPVALRAEATRQARVAALEEAVGVAVLSKDLLDIDVERGRYSEAIAVEFAFENRTERDVAGVKGTIEFLDMFGDRVYISEMSFDEGIAAGSTATWNGSIDYNQFMDDHVKLANTPLDKLEVVWQPEMVLFEDGTRLALEDES